MGSYADAIAASEATGLAPDITASRQNGRTKYGFGINEYQELGPLFRAFGRIGWNDGKNESFAYTEVDNTFEIGGDVRGTALAPPRRSRRPGVRQQRHLQRARRVPAAGRLRIHPRRRSGLHDQRASTPARLPTRPAATLSYARETIVEQYYNFHIWGGAFAAEDVQFVANPGYNSARGPVWVLSLRGHLEF